MRLLTLTGPSGIGKTRLASRIGEEIAGRGTIEVRAVELAPVTEPTHPRVRGWVRTLSSI